MRDRTGSVLTFIFVSAFFFFAVILLHGALALAQSREEASKPPVPIRPSGTTGVTGALPEVPEQSPVFRGMAPTPSQEEMQRQMEDSRKREEEERIKRQLEFLQRSPLERSVAPTSKPPDPSKPQPTTGGTGAKPEPEERGRY